MRIIELVAENIKKLRVVQIRPDGAVIQITGANGSGKSSVLDAIFWALAGERNIDAMPVRRGEKKAKVRLDLGDVVVTRRFTAGGGSTLMVEATNGARFPSPQRLLDDLLGALTFDPLEFVRMDSAKQANALRQLVGLSFHEIDHESQVAYTERTDVNRAIRSLTERASAVETEIDPGADVEPIDISALLDQMQKAAAQNAERQQTIGARNREDDHAENLRQEALAIDEQIERLRQRQDAVMHELKAVQVSIGAREELPPPTDTAALRRQIEDARRINDARKEQAHIRETHQRLIDELQAKRADAENLTATIDSCTQRKLDAISQATFPVEGLSFNADGEVTYNDIPFDQASSAEQLRVSVALAMAINPKLRVLRIKEGSLLDETSLALIGAMAEERDYQVWVERVDSSHKVGIAMEDGAIVAVDGEPVAAEEVAV